MGALVSLAAAPASMMASCCASLAGGCIATALCKACSCYCTATQRITSVLYFGAVTIFVLLACYLRIYGGDIVIGGSFNSTEESILDKAAHMGTSGARDYWNNRFYCAPAHHSGFIICCANKCAGDYAVYRFSFVLCLFFAFLCLCTIGTTKFGARAHRGFWFLKAFVLLSLLIASLFVDNHAMEAYRDVAKYVSFIFLVLQIILLIDFGYLTNEKLVDWDEQSDYEGPFSWKMCLLVAALFLYGSSIALWVVSAQWFGMDGCGPQQALITLTILITLGLSVVSCTKIAPHGTLFTSAVVTAYASYQCYSALSHHPSEECNQMVHSSASDFWMGVLVYGVAMLSVARSATNSRENLFGKSSGNSDLTVNLDTGAGGSSDANANGDGDDTENVGPESWWYYHLMMVVSSLYMAMLLTNWSMQPTDQAPSSHGAFSVSLESFWIKIVAQWTCLLMYGWTLLAPYLLRDVRDFGIEFDFD